MSDRLNALLDSGDSPIVGPNTAGALRTWLDSQPELPCASPERIENMIARLAMATKERPLSRAENKVRIDLYCRVLRDVPLIDVVAGFDVLLARCTFMPTPAEVLGACMPSKAKREFRYSRARWLIWLHERDWQPAVEMAAPEEVQIMLADMRVAGEKVEARDG